MAERKEFKLSADRLDGEHLLGPLVPIGRFDWERILGRCLVEPASAKLVAYTMATFADVQTGSNIRPGDDRIAFLTGMSNRSVERATAALRQFGLLHVVQKGSNSGRGAKASTYRLTAPLRLAEQYRAEQLSGIWNDHLTGHWRFEDLKKSAEIESDIF